MRPTKTSHTFEVRGNSVRFSSNFDSGNLRTVTQIGQKHFLAESSLDSYEFQCSRKSFFHFNVENYPIDEEIVIDIPKISLLEIIKEEYQPRYRPCFSVNGHNYDHLDTENVKIFRKDQRLVLRIVFTVTSAVVYFAFSLPYPYERYLNMVRDLPNESPDFYIKKEVLCYSKNLNLVYMITITSFDKLTDQQDTIGALTNGVIMPEKHIDNKRPYFDKPVILISARVHPGESPSSWAIEGIIQFLIGSSDKAKSLRENFQIVIVPMLNPDGVYEGLYRLDTMGHNLNRYYLISDNRQPSIYGMKHLIKHYNISKRLLYYFDFHGHPSYKGSFMYGNAIDEIAYQAETELFGRIMSLKCPTFEEKYCIFDREQMSSKDKYDMYTKEGCARVYAWKTANILHAYTIEMGFHSCTELSGNAEKSSQNFRYTSDSYYNEGVSVLESVLESCGLENKMNRKAMRIQVTNEILLREERFKKEDKHISKKRKSVNESVENEYWKPIRNRFFTKKFEETKKSFITRQTTPKTIQRDLSSETSRFLSREGMSTQYSRSDTEKFSENLDSLKTLEIEEKKLSEMLLYREKKNIENRQIIFSFRNRKFVLDSNEKEQQKDPFNFYLKPGLQEEKSKTLEKEKTKINKISFNRSEESMFDDNNLRDDGGSSKAFEDKRLKKSKFSIISDSKANSNMNEIKEMFKLDKLSKPQLGMRRSAKLQKFNSLKL